MAAWWDSVWSQVPGLWRLRLAGLIAGGVTAGVAGLLMASPAGPSIVIPGPLQSFHASLADECTKCHVASSQAVLSVFHGIVATDIALDQSKKCMACHSLGPDALYPHAWSRETARAKTAEAQTFRVRVPASLAAGSALGVPRGEHGELPCAACHHEHRGRREPLARLTAQQCQGCHTGKFLSFQHGHAEFADFPYVRRSRLVFDHAAHIGRHFESEAVEHRPSECTSCHYPDATGDHLLVRDFEDACAGCHSGEVHGETQVDSPGLTIFAVPSLDLDTLSERGIFIGHWPADASFTETAVTPLLQLLLSPAPGAAELLRSLEKVDLLDLSDATDAQLAAVEQFAWAIKGFCVELLDGGHAWLHARIEVAAGRGIGSEESMDLIGELPGALVAAAADAWFPGLEAEWKAHRAGAGTIAEVAGGDATEDFSADPKRESWVNQGGWYRQDLDYSIRYRPKGHADPFLRAWLDLTAERSAGSDFGAMLDHLSAPDAVGRCTKCHSVDVDVDGRHVVNWRAATQLFGPAGVTRFSHAAHFPAVGERGCITCHMTADHGSRYLDSFSQPDPSVFTPDFAPMTLATCQQCHSSRAAADTCLTCHNYHARAVQAAVPHAPLTLPEEDDADAGS